MSLYFVDYDLRTPGRNYKGLYDALESLGAVRILESTWGFEIADTNAAAIRDYLMKLIDQNDGLSVSQVTDWATYGTLGTPNYLPRQRVPR